MTPPLSGYRCDVTVVIPTRNAGPLLGRVLDGVFGQDTRKRLEVIALDRGSADGTVEHLRRRSVRVIAVAPDQFDWGRARDRMFEEAGGEIVANLSQDAVPAHDKWVENLVRPLDDPLVGASCGTSLPDPDRGFPQFQWERNGFFYFTRETRKFVSRYGKGLSFANAAVRRDVWERLRIDPQPTGEDFQFQTKLYRAGLRIAFTQDAAVLHHHNYNLREIILRCRNEGLALRKLGCGYNEFDLLLDLLSTRKYLQWLREIRHGTLGTLPELLYPLLRPVAVYMGSRFARRHLWG